MTAAEIDTFFKGYADAFSRQDVEAICGLWDYPAFMSYGGRQAVLDATSFHNNTVALCAFYGGQGLHRAHKEVLEIVRLTETTASVRTADTLFDADDVMIAAWEHVYLLSKTPSGLKAVVALPDNELRVWRDRGTPMGGGG